MKDEQAGDDEHFAHYVQCCMYVCFDFLSRDDDYSMKRETPVPLFLIESRYILEPPLPQTQFTCETRQNHNWSVTESLKCE